MLFLREYNNEAAFNELIYKRGRKAHLIRRLATQIKVKYNVITIVKGTWNTFQYSKPEKGICLN